jgi:hypothetical protein
VSVQQSVWQKYVQENIPNLDKLFASTGWKRAFLPWLKAQREVKLRTVLEAKDANERDVARGMVLAFEQIAAFPEALLAFKEQLKTPQQQAEQQTSTDYIDSIQFEDE